MPTTPLPPNPPHSATEFEMLTAFLDYYRGVMIRKIEGLDAEGLRRSPVKSGTSLGGLLKHLGYVERHWFSRSYGGLEMDFPWTEDDPDADFRLNEDDTAASLVAFYQAECERSREMVAANPDLDHVVPTTRDRRVSLRWILVHMIEETARHAGHADIIREMVDGEVGD
ncbi:MAG: DinB family protein [Acidimicrobiia bacterium]